MKRTLHFHIRLSGMVPGRLANGAGTWLGGYVGTVTKCGSLIDADANAARDPPSSSSSSSSMANGGVDAVEATGASIVDTSDISSDTADAVDATVTSLNVVAGIDDALDMSSGLATTTSAALASALTLSSCLTCMAFLLKNSGNEKNP